MKKVIFAVKRLYSFISEFVVLIEDDPLIFATYYFQNLRLKNKFARIYIIYMLKKYLVKRY